MDLLYDIYGVHKALLFGQHQRDDYTVNQFVSDIEMAKKNIFGDDFNSAAISKTDPRLKLSFYPEYLILDDVFAVMACHFAVSSVVNTLSKKTENGNQLKIRSVVIPSSICSRFDIDTRFRSNIDNVDGYLQRLASPGVIVSRCLKSDGNDVHEMARVIQEILMSHFPETTSNGFVIVFNRQIKNGRIDKNISVFGCDDWSKMDKLQQNYFIGIDFITEHKVKNQSRDMELVVKCWLHFGIKQKF